MTSGILKLKDDVSLDHEATDGGTMEVSVRAKDMQDNYSAPTVVTVTVGDVHENSAPTVSVSDVAEVAENDMSGVIVGTVMVNDDMGDTHTFAVNNDKFEVDDSSGTPMLKLKDGMYLNHEDGDGTVTVTVTATDDGDPAMSGSTDVTITVTDVNDMPTISAADASEDVDENVQSATITAVTVTDQDVGDEHEITVTGDDGDRFEVVDGMLKLKDGAHLDHETDGTVTVTVTVTDGGDPAHSARHGA